MSQHPIVMSTTSVQAILDGQKTVTRRVVSPRNSFFDGGPWPRHARPGLMGWQSDEAIVDPGPSPAGNPGPYLKLPWPDDESRHRIYPRVWHGDLLWVREAHKLRATEWGWEVMARDGMTWFAGVEVDPWTIYDATDSWTGLRWRSPIHMPRWASRLLLDIVDVRPERLQAITTEDAAREGFDSVDGFRVAWDRLNAKHGYPWGSNPWVWRIEFRRSARRPP